MRRRCSSRLRAPLGLLLAGLVVALGPAGTAAAAGQVCMGIVVDEGGGAAPSVQAAQVAPGTSDLQALSDVGQSPVQNAAGLVCAVGGYPANGLQTCLSASSGLYFYWSYWEGDPFTNTWTYASIGPASHTVSTGQTYVEGWRYQDPGPASPAATKPAVSPAVAYAQACPGVPPVASSGGTTGGSGAGSAGAGGSGGSGVAVGSSVTTTTAGPGSPGGSDVATSPAPGGSVAAAGGTVPGGNGGAATAVSPRSTPAGGPATVAPSASGATGSTTTVAGAADHPGSAGPAALAAARGQQPNGSRSPLPIVAVTALAAVMGFLAWLRWRRRPVEGRSEE